MKKVVVISMALAASAAWAGRPLAIDDADPVDPGRYEFEAGLGYERSPGCDHWDYPFAFTAGVFPGLEAGAGLGGQLEERTERVEGSGTEQGDHVHGIGDLTLGAKWQAVTECPLGARHALAVTMKLPTADNDKDLGSGEPDTDVMWIVSRGLGARMGMHFNAGYSWIGGPDPDVLHYGMAVDYQLAEAVQWVGEASVEQELAGDEDVAARCNTGFRWCVLDSLTLDVAVGSALSGEAPDFSGMAGLTWAFGVTGDNSR